MYIAIRTFVAALLGTLISATAFGQDNIAYPAQKPEVSWPTQSWPLLETPDHLPLAEIRDFIEHSFDDDQPEALQGGRGVVVIYQGELVAEKYGAGYRPDQRNVSWSLAKSVTQALVGIAVRDGLLDVDAPAPVPEWQGEDDPRRAITLDNLLRMSSGLEFQEGAGGLDDSSRMMFGIGRRDVGAYASNKPLIREPGTHWAYSTGTSNIISRIVRDAVGGDEESYRAFIQSELLDPLGMSSAIAEFDASGTFSGGTSFFATTRDYARFGLLYLRDGMWEGRRILPEGWVDYTRTPTPNSDNKYGAHFWLRGFGPVEQLEELGLSYPEDSFSGRGMGGQFVVVVPSKDLVIAYNGWARQEGFTDLDPYFARIISFFPDVEPTQEATIE